jgi:hypothetical protein
MSPFAAMNVIALRSPWYRRAIDQLLDHLLAAPRPAVAALRGIDARTLADIGIDASEIGSIEAEAHGSAHAITRRRIVAMHR